MHPIRRVLFTLSGLALAASASAQSASSAAAASFQGLGSAWPSTADVSASPRFHVYRWDRAGITYIQVNDLAGRPRAALATDGRSFVPLPIGADAARISTPDHPLALQAGTGHAEAVYNDAAIQLALIEPSATAAGDDPIWDSRPKAAGGDWPTRTTQANTRTQQAQVASDPYWPTRTAP